MGALTLKVFSNELREWEFIEGEGIDPTDSFGVNLRLSIRENQIFLAEPSDPEITWITDRGRLFFDGMFNKNDSDNNLEWESFFNQLSEYMYFIDHLNFSNLNSFSIFLAFENVSLETLNMLYSLEQICSIIKLKKVENDVVNSDFESNYLVNDSTEKSKLRLSTFGLLLNTNPRYEGYVLNLNLRQRFLKGNFKLVSIGSFLDLTLPVCNLGSNFNILKLIGEGTHTSCQEFKNSEFPFIISNIETFKRNDAKILTKILKYTNLVNTAWNGINILNKNISSAGISSLNKFLPITTEDFLNFFGLYFINSSLNSSSNLKKITELQLLGSIKFSNINQTIFINQNSVDTNKSIYDKIKLKSKIYDNYFYLPNNLFLEDNETYINTQGLIKRTTKLLDFKKEAKSNWQIIRKIYSNSKKISFINNKKDNKLISFNCSNIFNYKNFINFQFYASKSLTVLSFYLTKQNKFILNKKSINEKILVNSFIKETKLKSFNTKLKNWLDDFFIGNGNDSFSYNSSMLATCSKMARTSSSNFF